MLLETDVMAAAAAAAAGTAVSVAAAASSAAGRSSCAKRGKRTWTPPTEFRVEWTECVTTAFTSCKERMTSRES